MSLLTVKIRTYMTSIVEKLSFYLENLYPGVRVLYSKNWNSLVASFKRSELRMPFILPNFQRKVNMTELFIEANTLRKLLLITSSNWATVLSWQQKQLMKIRSRLTCGNSVVINQISFQTSCPKNLFHIAWTNGREGLFRASLILQKIV